MERGRRRGAPRVGRNRQRSCASAYSIEGASDAREYLADVLAHGIKLLEMFKNMSNSLVDLELVVCERPHARAELFIAPEFDLGEGFDQDIPIGVHFADQGLDTEHRRLQRHQLGLRLCQRFLE